MAGAGRSRLPTGVAERLERVVERFEKVNLAELAELYREPRRMLLLSFVSGIFRGFGIAVGFTLVGALFLTLLLRLARLNLPVIGEFIAEMAQIVQSALRGGP